MLSGARSSKGYAQLPMLRSWWHAQSRSLHQRLILLTVVVLLLSALMLLHSIVTKERAAEGAAQQTLPGLALFRSTPQDAAVGVPAAEDKSTRKQTLINLAPPLSRATLGHATWSLLHTMAALYPDSPSLAKQSAMRSFLTSLGELYPCATCARHYRLFLAAHPLPDVLSRDAVAHWLCEAHNAVNERTDKPIVDCAHVHDMWPPKLEQDCGCGDDTTATSTDEVETDAPTAAAAAAVADRASAAAPAASSLRAGEAQSQAGPGDSSPLSPAALAAAIAAQEERDARGAHAAALVDEEEREQRLAAEEDERQKQRERAAGLVTQRSA